MTTAFYYRNILDGEDEYTASMIMDGWKETRERAMNRWGIVKDYIKARFRYFKDIKVVDKVAVKCGHFHHSWRDAVSGSNYCFCCDMDFLDKNDEEVEIEIIMEKRDWYLAQSSLDYYVFKKGYYTMETGGDYYYEFDNFKEALQQFYGCCIGDACEESMKKDKCIGCNINPKSTTDWEEGDAPRDYCDKCYEEDQEDDDDECPCVSMCVCVGEEDTNMKKTRSGKYY